MKKSAKLLSLFLVLVFISAAFGCAEKGSATPDEQTGDNTLDKELEINVTVLSGTTGMGMAQLISERKAGNAALNYKFEVISDATQISAGIIGGNIDIAAVPSNLASTLYKKTNGGIQVLALNNLGVLYLLENGNTVNSISDLRGKTVYVPGKGTNPEYILQYILERNGLTVGTDVTFDYTYSTPDTLSTAVTAGLASIALLPEPKVTAVESANIAVRTAVDISAEWDKVAPAGSLAQSSIIARKEFIDAHNAEICAFLEEFKESLEFVNSNPESASQLIADAGIIPKAALALKAIPKCNLRYIDGDDMKAALTNFFDILYSIEPKSIGGEIPAEGLYFKRL